MYATPLRIPNFDDIVKSLDDYGKIEILKAVILNYKNNLILNNKRRAIKAIYTKFSEIFINIGILSISVSFIWGLALI